MWGVFAFFILGLIRVDSVFLSYNLLLIPGFSDSLGLELFLFFSDWFSQVDGVSSFFFFYSDCWLLLSGLAVSSVSLRIRDDALLLSNDLRVFGIRIQYLWVSRHNRSLSSCCFQASRTICCYFSLAFNPLTAKLFNSNLDPLEVIS